MKVIVHVTTERIKTILHEMFPTEHFNEETSQLEIRNLEGANEKLKRISKETHEQVLIDVFRDGTARQYTIEEGNSYAKENTQPEKGKSQESVNQLEAEIDLSGKEWAEARDALRDFADKCPYGTIVRCRLDQTPCEVITWKVGLAFHGKEFTLINKKTEATDDGKMIFEFEKTAAKTSENKVRVTEAKPFFERPKKQRELPPMRSVPNTSFTAEDAINKLETEMERNQEAGSEARWVVDQLKNKCRQDTEFTQYVMLESKTFVGAFQYILNLAKEKLIGTIENTIGGYSVDLSKEDSLIYFEEYFRYDENEVERRKKEEADKKREELKKKREKAEETSKRKNQKKPKESQKPSASSQPVGSDNGEVGPSPISSAQSSTQEPVAHDSSVDEKTICEQKEGPDRNLAETDSALAEHLDTGTIHQAPVVEQKNICKQEGKPAKSRCKDERTKADQLEGQLSLFDFLIA